MQSSEPKSRLAETAWERKRCQNKRRGVVCCACAFTTDSGERATCLSVSKFLFSMHKGGLCGETSSTPHRRLQPGRKISTLRHLSVPKRCPLLPGNSAVHFNPRAEAFCAPTAGAWCQSALGSETTSSLAAFSCAWEGSWRLCFQECQVSELHGECDKTSKLTRTATKAGAQL